MRALRSALACSGTVEDRQDRVAGDERHVPGDATVRGRARRESLRDDHRAVRRNAGITVATTRFPRPHRTAKHAIRALRAPEVVADHAQDPEDRQLGQLAVQPDAGAAEVGLRLLARRMHLGDGHLRAAGLLAAHRDNGNALVQELDFAARSGRRPATRGSSPGACRAAARHGRPACGAAAAPTAAPDGPSAGARGGGAPALGWTRPPCGGLAGYARTAPPSTTPLPSPGEVTLHPSVVTGSVGGGATSDDQNGPRWGHFR